jgi:O-antigen ligase
VSPIITLKTGRSEHFFPRDILLWSYSLLLLWIPLPAASNRVASAIFLELVVLFLLFIWCLQYWQGHRSLPSLFAHTKLIFTVWLLFIALILFQLLPLPIAWIEWISPQSGWLKLLAYNDTTPPLWGTLSVDIHSTVLALHRTIAYFGLFILTLLLVRRTNHYRWIASVLLISGVFQAFYGSLMVLTGWEFGFIFEKTHYRNVATGTFVNRNNFANYLVMAAAVGIGLLLSKTAMDEKKKFIERLRSLLNWLMSGNIWIRFALIIIATGIVLSRSRMGNVSFLSSLFIAAFLFLWLKRYLTKGTMLLIISILVIDLFIVGSLVGVDRVVERVQSSSLESEHRDEVVEDTLRYWQDFPLIGSGGGSYYTTYPRYKDGIVSGYYDHAHNDYLEIASEYGLIGLLLLALIPTLTLWRLIPIYRLTDDGTVKGVSFTLMMATIALATHAIVDFNLQIPANVSTFIVVIGLAWTACGRYWRRNNQIEHHNRFFSGSIQAKIVLSILIATVLACALWGASTGLADHYTEQSKYHMAHWNKEQTIDTAKWRQLIINQEKAIRYDTTNDRAKLNLARLLQWHEVVENISIEQRDQTNEEIIRHIKESIQNNPGFAPAWLALSRLQEKRGRFGQTFLKAIKMADLLAPWESRIQLAIIDIGLKNWYRLPEEHQKTVIATLSRNLTFQSSQSAIMLIQKYQREAVICRVINNKKLAKICYSYAY